MNKIDKLAADFRAWGKARIRKVRTGVQKYGVIFNDWFDGQRG